MRTGGTFQGRSLDAPFQQTRLMNQCPQVRCFESMGCIGPMAAFSTHKSGTTSDQTQLPPIAGRLGLLINPPPPLPFFASNCPTDSQPLLCPASAGRLPVPQVAVHRPPLEGSRPVGFAKPSRFFCDLHVSDGFPGDYPGKRRLSWNPQNQHL